MSFGFWQIIVIAILVILLFGRGRISDLMGDLAKGIKSFKKGLADEPEAATPTTPPQQKIPDMQQADLRDVTPNPISEQKSPTEASQNNPKPFDS